MRAAFVRIGLTQAERMKVQLTDNFINEPGRMARTNVIIDRFRQQKLLAVIRFYLTAHLVSSDCLIEWLFNNDHKLNESEPKIKVIFINRGKLPANRFCNSLECGDDKWMGHGAKRQRRHIPVIPAKSIGDDACGNPGSEFLEVPITGCFQIGTVFFSLSMNSMFAS